jgi:hypothetical protein
VAILKPSRRVLLFTIVAVACGVVVVGLALLSLAAPEDRLSELRDRVLPASAALDHTRVEAARSEQLFLKALSSPPGDRSSLIADSQAAVTLGSASWREYQRVGCQNADR